MKKFKISRLTPDSRYLQTLALLKGVFLCAHRFPFFVLCFHFFLFFMSGHLRSVPMGPLSGNTKAVVFTAHQVSQFFDISATQLVAKTKSQSTLQDHKMNLRFFFFYASTTSVKTDVIRSVIPAERLYKPGTPWRRTPGKINCLVIGDSVSIRYAVYF